MNNIILIGFMGCGKSTFGKWLANKQNMMFVDTDKYIEQQQGISVSEIFETHGEEYFRNLETQLLCDFLGMNGEDKRIDRTAVIAVGGGLAVREENRKLLSKLGKIVYLDTSIEELVKRLENDTTRPLLKGGSLIDKISTLMDARRDIYEDVADIIVETDGRSMYELYEGLLQLWRDK